MELRLEVRELILQRLLFRCGVFVLVLQRLHLVQHHLQFLLRLLQRRLLLLQRLLRRLELGAFRRHLLGDVAVDEHRVHPLAQALGGARDGADLLRRVLGVVHVLLHLAQERVVQLVLVEVEQAGQELRVPEHLLGGVPGGRLLQHRHHALEAQLNQRGRLGVRFQLGHVLLGQHVQRRLRGVQRGHSLVQARLALRGDGVGLLGVAADLRRLRRNLLLLVVGEALVGDDGHQQLLALRLGLRHHHLLLLRHDGHLPHLHAGFVQLERAPAQLVRHAPDLRPLLREERAVPVDEFQVVGGRDVVFPLERGEHLARFLRGGPVAGGEDFAQALLDLVVHLLLRLHLLLRHLLQRVRGPLREPVDGAAVHQAGEHAATLAEPVADGGHAQHDVQVLDDPPQEKRVQLILHLARAGFLRVRAHVLAQTADLVLREQVRHLAAREHVVDVLQERLDDDLRLVEEEHGGLVGDAGLPEELFQVLPELRQAVVLGDLDGEALELGDIRGEPRERLAPRAADAHQQRVAAGLAQHAVHAADVHERVAEQHEVHRRVPRLDRVLLQLLGEVVLQTPGVHHGFVRRVVHVGAHERDERRTLAVKRLEQRFPGASQHVQ